MAKGMEIEKKYLVSREHLPQELNTFPKHIIAQGYLSTEPVVRVRQSDDDYYLTYKSAGFMAREEYNLPLTANSFQHLLAKCDGNIICKTRYLIPFEKYTIELDVFHDTFQGVILAEVEFENTEEAEAFIPPAWFGEDVTFSSTYHNSTMSKATDLSVYRECAKNY